MSKPDKTYIRRSEILSVKPPVISQKEVKNALPRKKQDTFQTLKRDALKSLGDGDFAKRQWAIIDSYIQSKPKGESKRVTAARQSPSGTIDDLFKLIDKEIHTEFKSWPVQDGMEEEE